MISPVSQVRGDEALLHGRQRPAPAGQFAGDGDVGHERVLAALGERLPPLVETAVAGMPARPQRRIDLGPASPQCGARCAVGLTMMSGRFDQQPAHGVLAALVIDPCTREVPEECSEGTNPT